MASLRLLSPTPRVRSGRGLRDRILERTPETVQPPHHQRVAAARMVGRIAQARTFAGAASGVLEDALATLGPRNVAPQDERLVVGRDAGVSVA